MHPFKKKFMYVYTASSPPFTSACSVLLLFSGSCAQLPHGCRVNHKAHIWLTLACTQTSSAADSAAPLCSRVINNLLMEKMKS